MMEMVILLGGIVICVIILGYCVGGKIGIVYKLCVDCKGYLINEYCVFFVGVVFVSDLCLVMVVVVENL